MNIAARRDTAARRLPDADVIAARMLNTPPRERRLLEYWAGIGFTFLTRETRRTAAREMGLKSENARVVLSRMKRRLGISSFANGSELRELLAVAWDRARSGAVVTGYLQRARISEQDRQNNTLQSALFKTSANRLLTESDWNTLRLVLSVERVDRPKIAIQLNMHPSALKKWLRDIVTALGFSKCSDGMRNELLAKLVLLHDEQQHDGMQRISSQEWTPGHRLQFFPAVSYAPKDPSSTADAFSLDFPMDDDGRSPGCETAIKQARSRGYDPEAISTLVSADRLIRIKFVHFVKRKKSRT